MSFPSFLKHKPSKIVLVGLNYVEHAKEVKMEIPKNPILFMKPNTTIIGPDEHIILPKDSKRVDYEAELAIVISKKCKNVPEEEALSVVEGFTCLNDISARDFQMSDGQWTRAKSFDTFCPIGPKIVDVNEIDPNNAKIQLFLNGEKRQDSSTSDFIFNVHKVISFVSNIMTLLPGDIISTGTPSGIGPLKSGDVVEVKIEGIGTLKNFVK